MPKEGPKRLTTLVNSGGFKLSTTSGTLDIHIKEFNCALVNKSFLYFTGSVSNISSAVSPGNSMIGITASTSGMVNSGDSLVITESGTNLTETQHLHIVSQSAGITLGLDRQLCNSYSQSAQIERVFDNMAQTSLTDSASPQNPIVFKVAPQTTIQASAEFWNITRIHMAIEDDTVPTDDRFGGMDKLANGISVIENKSDNIFLTHWHKNNDMILDAGVDVEYHPKDTGNTTHGVRVRWTLTKAGNVACIDGSNNESLEVWIQDDISGLVAMRMRAQGTVSIGAL